MNRVNAGRNGKLDGHRWENSLAQILGKHYQEPFKVLGSSIEKTDILSESGTRFSSKFVSNGNTQVALYSKSTFKDYFKTKLSPESIVFIELFFGQPNAANVSIISDYANQYGITKLSDKELHRNRVFAENIPQLYKSAFRDFMNDNKSKIFEILIETNLKKSDYVEKLVWSSKKTKKVEIFDIKTLRINAEQGNWNINNTILDFKINNCKLFHLQMKGSSKRFSSGFHSLMFHIHRKGILINSEVCLQVPSIILKGFSRRIDFLGVAELKTDYKCEK